MRTLLIDGIWGTGRWFGPLRRTLEAQIGPVEIYRYDASGKTPFETLGEQLAEKTRRIAEPVNIVAFSMGGLVVRAAHMVDRALPIHRAAFLNSPHRGSLLAHLLPRPAIRQMRFGAPFLQKLADVEWTHPTLVVWCPVDTMIIPGASAKWNRATRTICCPVPLHIWPLWSGRMHRRIARFFAEGN